MSISLYKISEQMKQESPVFIVGVPRSGTTILYRTIQQHANFSILKSDQPSKVQLSETAVFKNPYNTYLNQETYNNSDSEPFQFMMKNSELQEQFNRVTEPIQKFQRYFLGKELFQKSLSRIRLIPESSRTTLWSSMKNDLLIRSFFYFAKQSRGTQRLIEKTPKHIFYLPEIRRTFPKAKIIFVSRHPIDVFSSYRMRLQVSLDKNVDPRDLNWLKISPQAFCNQYSAQLKIALREARLNPDSFTIISYEDFTNNLRSTLENLFNFLGENFDANCIPKDENNQVEKKLDLHVWGKVTKKTKNWQDFVNWQDAAYIEYRLSEMMNTIRCRPYVYRERKLPARLARVSGR